MINNNISNQFVSNNFKYKNFGMSYIRNFPKISASFSLNASWLKNGKHRLFFWCKNWLCESSDWTHVRAGIWGRLPPPLTACSVIKRDWTHVSWEEPHPNIVCSAIKRDWSHVRWDEHYPNIVFPVVKRDWIPSYYSALNWQQRLSTCQER